MSSDLGDWADVGQLAEAELLARRERLHLAWESLLGYPEGRLVLEDIRLTCRLDHSALIYDAWGHVDVHRTMVRLGHQEVGLKALYRLGLTHDQLLAKLVAHPPPPASPKEPE